MTSPPPGKPSRRRRFGRKSDEPETTAPPARSGLVPPPPGYVPPDASRPDDGEPPVVRTGFVPPAPGYVPPGATARAEPEPTPEPEPEPEPVAEPEPEPEPTTAVQRAAWHGSVSVAAPDAAVAAVPSSRLPKLAWLAAAPAVLAIVGALLPWFAPTGTKDGQSAVEIPKAYFLHAGRIGFLAPVALVVAAIAVLGPRLGLFAKGQPTRPLEKDGYIVAGCGAGAALILAVAWVLLPASYTFANRDWTALENQGYDLQRAPQLGYFITIAAAVVALAAGAALVMAGRRAPD